MNIFNSVLAGLIFLSRVKLISECETMLCKFIALLPHLILVTGILGGFVYFFNLFDFNKDDLRILKVSLFASIAFAIVSVMFLITEYTGDLAISVQNVELLLYTRNTLNVYALFIAVLSIIFTLRAMRKANNK